MFQGIIF
jgi:hypothetical protein